MCTLIILLSALTKSQNMDLLLLRIRTKLSDTWVKSVWDFFWDFFWDFLYLGFIFGICSQSQKENPKFGISVISEIPNLGILKTRKSQIWDFPFGILFVNADNNIINVHIIIIINYYLFT